MQTEKIQLTIICIYFLLYYLLTRIGFNEMDDLYDTVFSVGVGVRMGGCTGWVGGWVLHRLCDFTFRQ